MPRYKLAGQRFSAIARFGAQPRDNLGESNGHSRSATNFNEALGLVGCNYTQTLRSFYFSWVVLSVSRQAIYPGPPLFKFKLLNSL